MAALAIACGGATVDVDGGPDVQQEAAPDTSGPYPCGTTTCQSGEVCVHPCCGGAPPPCVPFEDAGVCPAGYQPSNYCNGYQYGCAPPPCTPPPPYCTPASSGCPYSGMSSGRDCYEECA